jgi:PCI domain-containing protein
MKKLILLSIGILLVIIGLFFLGLTLSMTIAPPPEENEQGEEVPGDSSLGVCGMVICVPTFWVPAGFLIYFGLQSKGSSSGLGDVASILRSYDEISIEDAAEMLDLSERQTEKKITKCIGEGMVYGKIVNGIYYSHSKLDYFQKRTDWVERLKDVLDVLIAYRRVGIGLVAEKIGEDVSTTERLILECIEERLVKGYLSTKQHVFYTQDYLDQLDDVRVGWTCKKCGANHDEVLLPGDFGTCNYCGSLSGAKGTSIVDPEKEIAYEVIEL